MKKTIVKIKHPLTNTEVESIYLGDVSVIVGDSSITVIEHDKKQKTTKIEKNNGIVSVRNWG